MGTERRAPEEEQQQNGMHEEAVGGELREMIHGVVYAGEKEKTAPKSHSRYPFAGIRRKSQDFVPQYRKKEEPEEPVDEKLSQPVGEKEVLRIIAERI